jgi:carboxymethylenebutenolidase
MILVAAAVAPAPVPVAAPTGGSCCDVAFTAVSTEEPQDTVKNRLEKSPRHHEWHDVMNGTRKVETFVAFPEVKDKATAVLVIHDNKGLSDWARSVADQLAEAGYVAIAVDCLSGYGPGGGNTKVFKSAGEATAAFKLLKDDIITGDLNAAADYVLTLPASNGKLTACGFCWGGGQCFRFATNRKDLKAAFVFYGSFNDDKESLSRVQCPVYGFYAGDDMRINASLPKTTGLMKDLGKTYEPVKYDGAGHGFMRNAEENPKGRPEDVKARTESWERWKTLLKKV